MRCVCTIREHNNGSTHTRCVLQEKGLVWIDGEDVPFFQRLPFFESFLERSFRNYDQLHIVKYAFFKGYFNLGNNQKSHGSYIWTGRRLSQLVYAVFGQKNPDITVPKMRSFPFSEKSVATLHNLVQEIFVSTSCWPFDLEECEQHLHWEDCFLLHDS